MMAASNGHLKVVRMLLHHVDKYEERINCAMSPEDVLAGYLIRHEEDMASFKEKVCSRGKTARDYAEACGHQALSIS